MDSLTPTETIYYKQFLQLEVRNLMRYALENSIQVIVSPLAPNFIKKYATAFALAKAGCQKITKFRN